jgi:hypothetical protein
VLVVLSLHFQTQITEEEVEQTLHLITMVDLLYHMVVVLAEKVIVDLAQLIMQHLAVLVVELEEIIHLLVPVQLFHLYPHILNSLDMETQEEQLLRLEGTPVVPVAVAQEKQEELTNHLVMEMVGMEFYYLLSQVQ